MVEELLNQGVFDVIQQGILMRLISKWDVDIAYPKSSKQDERNKLADSFNDFIVDPNRLLILLGYSLKYLNKPATFNIFTGKSTNTIQPVSDSPALTSYNVIKFPKNQYPKASCYSGNNLITGTSDGFIELWDYKTGKLDTSLSYQSRDELMLIDSQVLSIAVALGSLAVGSSDGKITIFDPTTGLLKTTFKAHSQGVSTISFNYNGSQIASASFDAVIKIHGLKSNTLLKEFRGHSAFINDLIYLNHNQISTASSDGTVKIWDLKHGLISTLRFNQGLLSDTISSPVLKLCRLQNETIVVCNSSNYIYLVKDGNILKTIMILNICFTGIAISNSEKYLYATSDHDLYCFEISTGEVVGEFKSRGIVCLSVHPELNFASVCLDGGVVGLLAG